METQKIQDNTNPSAKVHDKFLIRYDNLIDMPKGIKNMPQNDRHATRNQEDTTFINEERANAILPPPPHTNELNYDDSY